VAFTATQIPGIEERVYPPELAGPNYPQGIPIHAEEELPELIKEYKVDQVIFAYSDVSHEYVMHKASLALANGADFRLMGPSTTMLKAKVPVVSICAVRTGSGKSQTSRRVCKILRDRGFKVVVIRHPMPYGDLTKQICQRFATYEDLDKYECTIEEREEYEPHIANGIIVYAGVDYEKILREAEKEADVIVWDGGNNDIPFYYPDLHIVVVDPHRPGHEMRYHPGETNLRMANVIVINKMDTANPANVEAVRKNVKETNPKATVIEAASPITVDDPKQIKGKRVLVVEDGPTLTHGNMAYGAGMIVAQRLGASEIVDPRPYAVGSIVETFREYGHLGPLLPAVGYGKEQILELQETINATPCDVVVIGTPIDLRRVLKLNKPAVRARYELQELGSPTLSDILKQHFPKKQQLGRT
ncbi:MAG: cyclic 2,3-diphosphoglycerate synthase, partial [Candidatus Bathyarchaeia archaeon]